MGDHRHPSLYSQTTSLTLKHYTSTILCMFLCIIVYLQEKSYFSTVNIALLYENNALVLPAAVESGTAFWLGEQLHWRVLHLLVWCVVHGPWCVLQSLVHS